MEPVIYMPAEAATATSPEGRRMVFFRVPQLDEMIQQVILARPDQYTYSWGYHSGHKVHVLMFQWPTGQGAGIAIPEGAGDMILNYMLGTTAVFLTTEPVQDVLSGSVSGEQVQKVLLGNTVGLTEVKFKPEA